MKKSLGYNWICTFMVVIFQTTSMAYSQKTNDVEVRGLSNEILDFAWTGGLNAPQFSEIDLNDDNIMDLFVFDREGSRILTFLNGGTSGQVDYSYAPEFESSFPVLTGFALMADYNLDGKNDIFTYNAGGIRVYKNISTSGNLQFKLEVNPYLKSNSGNGFPPSNIFVSSQDIPVISDIDSDGDLDVLSFGNNSEQLSFYENFAQDSGSIGTFKFHDNTYCWGNFREEALSNKVLLNQSCPKAKITAKGNKHSGASIMAFDPDGDGDKDLLLGDPTFTNLVFLENGGSNNYANMVSQDTLFPSYNVPVDLRIFPAAFNLDVNNDGLKDLIVAPNTNNGIENYKGVLYYKNIGTVSNSIYSFQTNNFLQGSSIELGSYAYPVLFDNNKDGLMDIVVGNGGYYKGSSPSIHSLALFENTGTATDPKFKLTDDDFADISTYNLNTSINKPTRNPIPCFGDINSDGSIDMIIGDFQGKLHYFQNEPIAGKNNFVMTEANFKRIDVGNDASPFLTDLDGDGLTDLIIGKQNGKLNFYKNKGSNTGPHFDSIPDIINLGQVNTTPWNEYDGYSQARFYKANHELFMLSGSITGTIYQYGQISGNLSGAFTLIDSVYLGIDVGSRSHVETGDLNSDGKFDYIVGNSCGGLNFYLSDELIGIKKYESQSTTDWTLKISQITDETFSVTTSISEPGNLEIYAITGQKITSGNIVKNHIIDLSDRQNGIYLVTVQINQVSRTQKIILAR